MIIANITGYLLTAEQSSFCLSCSRKHSFKHKLEHNTELTTTKIDSVLFLSWVRRHREFRVGVLPCSWICKLNFVFHEYEVLQKCWQAGKGQPKDLGIPACAIPCLWIFAHYSMFHTLDNQWEVWVLTSLHQGFFLFCICGKNDSRGTTSHAVSERLDMQGLKCHNFKNWDVVFLLKLLCN